MRQHSTFTIDAMIQDLFTTELPTTGAIRKESAKYYRQLCNKSIDAVLPMCDRLLEAQSSTHSLVAFDWAFRLKKQYDQELYYHFEQWLFAYIQDWYDCDDFCTHAFGELLCQYPQHFESVMAWTTHEHFAVRRAAAVVFILAIRSDRYKTLPLLTVADALIEDPHDLVQKGYGWMLKVLSQKEPHQVIEYLEQNHRRMPRVAFRYALEKLPKSERQRLINMK
ncbi:DNA alkylation repair protein [Vibrio sonorensis]|uniref:DNA alkylation repair protein n=1 Tax=Vibrio sonorensis TaxID=1004316 RepID=UPI000A028CF5|nr:DNA alkylation repair protein [Vibrio sonorensis]